MENDKDNGHKKSNRDSNWKEVSARPDPVSPREWQPTFRSKLAQEKMWSADELETTCGHKAKDITTLIAWRRDVERGSARLSSLMDTYCPVYLEAVQIVPKDGIN